MNRIGFVSLMSGFPWGGSEVLWAKTASKLSEEMQLVVSVYDWSKEISLIRQLKESKSVRVIFRSKRFFSMLRILRSAFRKVFGIRRYFWNSYAFLRRQNFDLVVINMGSTYDFLEHVDLTHTLYSTKLPYVVICQYNQENGTITDNERQQTIKFFSNARRVYFVSTRNWNVAERQLSFKIHNAEVVFNPTNLKQVDSVVKELDSLNVNFACVARLDCSFKGQDILLETLSHFKWKERTWILNIYGTGPDESYLKKLTQFYGLESRVRFHGHCDDVKTIYTKNHVLVLPSVGEGTPLAMIEALYMGCPIVGTDVGDISVWVEDGKTGFLALAPSVRCLDIALENFWSNRLGLDELSKNALAKVLEKFPLDPISEFKTRLIDLIN